MYIIIFVHMYIYQFFYTECHAASCHREELLEYWTKVIAIDKVTEFNKHHCSAALKAFIDVDGALLGDKVSYIFWEGVNVHCLDVSVPYYTTGSDCADYNYVMDYISFTFSDLHCPVCSPKRVTKKNLRK